MAKNFAVNQLPMDVTRTGNGERGTGNGERGTRNGERVTGSGSLGTSCQRKPPQKSKMAVPGGSHKLRPGH